MKLVGDADADWSGHLEDRKSTTGYYFKFQGNGAAISWGVKKQSTVALRSTEVEYQAMTAGVQEAIINKRFWLSAERANPDWRR